MHHDSCNYKNSPQDRVLRGMVLLGNCMPLVRRYVGLFAGSGIFLKDGHSHHLSGFFAGDCVHEEVLDEDFRA